MRSLAKIFNTNSRWSLTFLGNTECVEVFPWLTIPSICVIAKNFGSGLCGHQGEEKLLHVDEVSIPAGMARYIPIQLKEWKELCVFLVYRK